MNRIGRRLLASFVLAAFALTLTWSVSPEALADWLASQDVVPAATFGDGQQPAPEDGKLAPGKLCNEGCHVFNHLQGMIWTVALLFPALADATLPEVPLQQPLLASKRLTRPPK